MSTEFSHDHDQLEPNLFDCVGHDWPRPATKGVNRQTDFFRVYDPIQRHYHCVFSKSAQLLDALGRGGGADFAIFLEDDLSIGRDLFLFFRGAEALVRNREKTKVWCASGWNDNGIKPIVKSPHKLLRTDFFPGLGWMTTGEILRKSVLPKWQHYPSTGWDHWLRLLQLGDCVYPEWPRTHHVLQTETTQSFQLRWFTFSL